jgi:hypothetical protein
VFALALAVAVGGFGSPRRGRLQVPNKCCAARAGRCTRSDTLTSHRVGRAARAVGDAAMPANRIDERCLLLAYFWGTRNMRKTCLLSLRGRDVSMVSVNALGLHGIFVVKSCFDLEIQRPTAPSDCGSYSSTESLSLLCRAA